MTLPMEMPKKSPTSTRGFASMDPEKQRAIARKGGESIQTGGRRTSQNPRLVGELKLRPEQQSMHSASARWRRLPGRSRHKGGRASHTGPKIVGGQG